MLAWSEARPPERPGDRRRWLALTLLVALIGAALRWQTMKVGLMSDDFMQHGMLAGLYPGGPPVGDRYAPFDLYAFLRRGEVMVLHVEQGTAPWWSAAELHGTVFRPLASLLLWLDHTLLPGRVVAWHLHTMAWFVAATVALGFALRRMLPAAIALIATALFACDAGLITPLCWLANRCVLICACFGFWAIWAHLEWRAPDPATSKFMAKHGRWVELGLLAACFAAGEYGFAIVALILAWELLGARDELRARLLAAAPALGLALAYLLIHKLGGYGTYGAEVYADPFHTPLGYLKWAGRRLPKLITAGFWSVPGATIHVFRFPPLEPVAELWVPENYSNAEYRWAHVKMALTGVGAAILTTSLARAGLHPEERRQLRAIVVGGLLGLLPIAIAPAHSRLLVVAQFAACALVAAILVAAWRLLLGRGLRRLSARSDSPSGAEVAEPGWPRRLVLLPFALALAWQHTVNDGIWGRQYTAHLDELQAANEAAFFAGGLLDRELEGREVVMLNGPSQTVGLFGAFVLDAHGWPAPASWRSLALGEFSMFARRPAPNTLELEAINGAWMHSAGELFFRREDQPLRVGEVIEYPGLRVEILAVAEQAEGGDAGHPTRIRFVFPKPLDDPSYLFVSSTKAGIRPWPLPAVGKTGVVPIPHMPPITNPDALVFPSPEPRPPGR